MISKFKNQSGETIVEALAAILIASLSVSMLFFAIMASVKINEQAKYADTDYYNAISAAEKQDIELTPYGKITIDGNSQNFKSDIIFFGDNDIYSYKKK